MKHNHYYQAQWPVLDDRLTHSQAFAIARADLYRLMAAGGIEPLGEPEFSTAEVAGQLFVNARVPARRAEP